MHTIVVGANGTARSEDALAFAHRLARGVGAQILLVDVIVAPAAADAELLEPYADLSRAEADAASRRLRALAGPQLAIVTRTVVAESAARGLQEVADELGADLIVVGSSHVGRLGRVLPGSTGERLLHGARCPVAIVPLGEAGRPWKGLRTVGVAHDGTPEAASACDLAIALARSTGARLRVLRVCEPPASAPAKVAGPGVGAAELEVLEGDAASELTRASSALDLLLLGSRGFGPLHSVLAGGVSGRVVRGAACPVIVVPRGAETTRLRAAGAARDRA